MESIEYNAFSECKNITEVHIHGNIENIGDNVFYNCENLEKIQLDEGIKTLGTDFIGGTEITELVIPKSVESMSYALYGAEELKKVTFTDGIEKIPDYVFANSYFYYPGAKVEEVIIPEGVIEIGQEAFRNCDNLSEIQLPASLKTVGGSVFYDCDALTAVIIPEKLTSIGSSMFSECDNLESVELTEGVGVIGAYAFYNCDNIESIEFPNSLQSIEYDAFNGCEKLTEIYIPGSVENIGSYAFVNCINLESIVLNDGVVTLGEGFIQGTLISEIVIPKTVEYAQYAFRNTKELTKVTFAQGMSKIPDYVLGKYYWDDTSNVQEVYVPSSITEVGYAPFDSIAGNIYLASEDCAVSIYAIDNEMVYTAKETGIADKTDGILARNKTSYNMGLSTSTTSGYVNLSIQYVLKRNDDSISDMQLKIKIPSAAELVPDTFKLNGKKYAVTVDENGYIYVPVENIEGTASFSVSISDISYLMSYAQLEYRYEYEYKAETIGIVNMAKNIFTLTVPDETASVSIDIIGFAEPGQSIDLYFEDEKIDTVIASKTGSYIKTFEIPNVQEGTMYKIEAKSSWGGEEYSVITYTTYTENAVELTKCKMYYRNQSYDLLELAGKRPVITWASGSEFTFKVSFSDNSKVGDVEIVSTKNGEVKKLSAVWNEQQEAFVASGFADYVPGNITIQYGRGLSECLVDSQATIISTYDVNNTQGYESEVTLQDGTMFYYLEEQELNISEVPESGFERVDMDGITGYLSSEQQYVEKDEKVYACQEFYMLQADGTYTLLRTGIGMQKVQTYRSSYRISLASDNDVLDYIGEVKELYEFLTTEISTDPENEQVYAWLNQTIETAKKAVEPDSQEAYELEQLGYQLELVELIGKTRPAFNQLNHVIENAPNYSNNPAGFDKVAEEISENMSNMVDAMNDCAKNVENKHLSEIIKKLTKKGWFGKDSLIERVMASMEKEAETAKLSFNAKYSIDPSGYVYEAVTGNRIEGATATIYYQNPETSEAALWYAEEYDQINPLYTDKDGMYAWDVPEGLWQVKIEKDGYEIAYSEWLPVPPPQLDVNIGLVSKAKPVVESFEVYPDYAKVVFSKYMTPETVTGLELTNATGENISYSMEYDTESVDLAGINYAKEYILRYAEGTVLEPDTNCTLVYDESVQCYAKIAMDTGMYETKVARHTEIIAPDEVTVKMEETLEIPIYIVNGNEDMEILAVSDYEEIAEVQSATVEKVCIYGNLYGNTEIVLGIAGTQIQKTIKVVVGKRAEEIQVENKVILQQEEYSMVVGETIEILPTIYPGNLAEGVWSVEGNQEIIEINGNNFTAKDAGEAILRYTLKDDATVFAECKVIVEDSGIAGDVNGDDKVNLQDSALLRRYLAGWNVVIDESAADVNGDGKLSLPDSAMLRRYLAGWNVELK